MCIGFCSQPSSWQSLQTEYIITKNIMNKNSETSKWSPSQTYVKAREKADVTLNNFFVVVSIIRDETALKQNSTYCVTS